MITSFQDGKGISLERCSFRVQTISLFFHSVDLVFRTRFSLSEKDNTSEKENTIQDYVQKYIMLKFPHPKIGYLFIMFTMFKGKGGYDAGIRIMKRGGSTEVIGNTIKIRGKRNTFCPCRLYLEKTPLPEQK